MITESCWKVIRTSERLYQMCRYLHHTKLKILINVINILITDILMLLNYSKYTHGSICMNQYIQYFSNKHNYNVRHKTPLAICH